MVKCEHEYFLQHRTLYNDCSWYVCKHRGDYKFNSPARATKEDEHRVKVELGTLFEDRER